MHRSPFGRTTALLQLVCFVHCPVALPFTVLLSMVMLLVVGTAGAQEERRLFAGAVLGSSTLSADGRSVTTASDAMLSLYKPENDLA